MPQQNSKAERGLATIASRTRAIMVAANIPEDIHYRIWSKVIQTACVLDGLTPVTIDGVIKSRVEHKFGGKPNCVAYLCTVGEAGTVKLRTKTTPKLSDRGKTCMYLGPAIGHNIDTHIMRNPRTGGAHRTRDVVWLRRMNYSKPAHTN
jgi:hypothetical protein